MKNMFNCSLQLWIPEYVLYRLSSLSLLRSRSFVAQMHLRKSKTPLFSFTGCRYLVSAMMLAMIVVSEGFAAYCPTLRNGGSIRLRMEDDAISTKKVAGCGTPFSRASGCSLAQTFDFLSFSPPSISLFFLLVSYFPLPFLFHSVSRLHAFIFLFRLKSGQFWTDCLPAWFDFFRWLTSPDFQSIFTWCTVSTSCLSVKQCNRGRVEESDWFRALVCGSLRISSYLPSSSCSSARFIHFAYHQFCIPFLLSMLQCDWGSLQEPQGWKGLVWVRKYAEIYERRAWQSRVASEWGRCALSTIHVGIRKLCRNLFGLHST